MVSCTLPLDADYCAVRIMFMREFSVIDSAVSIKQLRMRLKDNEFEQYGEAFIPEFAYEVIRRLPRFSSMRVIISSHNSDFFGTNGRCRGGISKMPKSF